MKPHVRNGLLPSLLKALMMGRSQTQKIMKESVDKVERLIMDGRQKALKIVANAMYGFTGSDRACIKPLREQLGCLVKHLLWFQFTNVLIILLLLNYQQYLECALGMFVYMFIWYTDSNHPSSVRCFGCTPGAQASPLQCIPLADSCLALGAATCRRACEIIEDLGALGVLGNKATTIRVIYAQTDSLFAFIPNASVEESIGKLLCIAVHILFTMIPVALTIRM